MSKVAIIGTAGRDKSITMTTRLWGWMCDDIASRIDINDHLVSGGAAWADHLAVWMFLKERCNALTLHLPAPLHGIFLGPDMGSASAANYYHKRFSDLLEMDSLKEIETASQMANCDGTFEPYSAGYGAFFRRNKKVAEESDLLYAYTFGEGDVPADGGTKDTWNQCKGKRIHIPLPRF